MAHWFTSDLHFGHANVIKYSRRPFANVDEMDEGLIAAWNERVAPTDSVHVIGDLSFHKPGRTAAIVSRLQGSIGLVLGNHDKKLPPEVLSRFAYVKDLHTVKVEDADAPGGIQRIVLCHYAMRVWDQSHRGAWQLYGHSHGSLPDDPRSRSIDVGVDCHGWHPISYDEVKAIMARKAWKPVDHHGDGR